MMDPHLARWRLMLGAVSDAVLGGDAFEAGLSAADRDRDAALTWLYERDGAQQEARGIRSTPPPGSAAGQGRSQLTVPDWLHQVHRLFPRQTIERLERDAVEQFGIAEVVTNAEALRQSTPNPALLRAILSTKHLMEPKVLGLARELVAKVVAQLMQRLSAHLRLTFAGPRLRRRSLQPSARNFDARSTVRANLANYDATQRRLVIKTPLFHARGKRDRQGHIILLVDESASMLDSVIHSAITAACLWRLPSLKTHIVIFDTEVVDLTDRISDPVTTLMSVQLGGGTNIGRAMAYAETLVENPRHTVVVLVSDLFEGAHPQHLTASVRRLTGQGVKVLALAALDDAANPTYNRELGATLAKHGAHVGAMTPMMLVDYLKEVLAP